MGKINRTSILAGMLIGIGVVINTFSENKYVGAMLFSFALLTIILKYLSVLLNLIFKQQRYLVADIEKVVKR